MNSLRLNIKTVKNLNINKVIKRTMFKKACQITYNNFKPKQPVVVPIYRQAHYSVENTNVMKSSHELTTVNPILGSIKKPFQHYTYVRECCEVENCEDKVCKEVCGTTQEASYIAHGSHNGTFKGARFASNIDFTGNPHAQYLITYENPVPVSNPLDINKDKTEQLNKDKQHVNNLHMNTKDNKYKKTLINKQNINETDDNIN